MSKYLDYYLLEAESDFDLKIIKTKGKNEIPSKQIFVLCFLTLLPLLLLLSDSMVRLILTVNLFIFPELAMSY